MRPCWPSDSASRLFCRSLISHSFSICPYSFFSSQYTSDPMAPARLFLSYLSFTSIFSAALGALYVSITLSNQLYVYALYCAHQHFVTIVSDCLILCQVISPTPNTTCHGGQLCTIEWLDDGQQPLLDSISSCSVALFMGDSVRFSFITTARHISWTYDIIATCATDWTCWCLFCSLHDIFGQSPSNWLRCAILISTNHLISRTPRQAPIRSLSKYFIINIQSHEETDGYA